MEIIASVGGVTVILAASFAFMVCLALMWKIWTADKEKAREYRELKKLAKLANKGDKTARAECENNPLIKKISA